MALHKAQTAPSYTSLDALAIELERVLKALGLPTEIWLMRLIGPGRALPPGSPEMLEVLLSQLESSQEAATSYLVIADAVWY